MGTQPTNNMLPAAEERQKDLLLLEQGPEGGGRSKPLVPKAIDADESDPDDSDDSDESDEEVCPSACSSVVPCFVPDIRCVVFVHTA